MKRVTFRVTVSDQMAEQIATGHGMIDSMFHGPFEVVSVEEFVRPIGVRTFDDDGGEIDTTWFDDGSEAFAKAKSDLRAGTTVKIVTREVVPA